MGLGTAGSLAEHLDDVGRRRHVRVAASEVHKLVALRRGGLGHAREEPREVLLREAPEPIRPLAHGGMMSTGHAVGAR